MKVRQIAIVSLCAAVCVFSFTLTAEAIPIISGSDSGSATADKDRWVNATWSQAVGFTITTTSLYTVDSLELDLAKLGTSNLTVQILADASGSPGSTVGLFNAPTTTISTDRSMHEFLPIGTVTLLQNNAYWITLTATGGDEANRHRWYGDGEERIGLVAQSAIITGEEQDGFLGYMKRRQSSSWEAVNYASYFTLEGTATAIPEPTTMLLLGSGLVGLAGFRRKFRVLDCNFSARCEDVLLKLSHLIHSE